MERFSVLRQKNKYIFLKADNSDLGQRTGSELSGVTESASLMLNKYSKCASLVKALRSLSNNSHRNALLRASPGVAGGGGGYLNLLKLCRNLLRAPSRIDGGLELLQNRTTLLLVGLAGGQWLHWMSSVERSVKAACVVKRGTLQNLHSLGFGKEQFIETTEMHQ